MKKLFKGMMVLSIGALLAGCSCNKENNTPLEQIETGYDSNKVFDDVNTNFNSIYNEASKSTVRIIAKNQLGSGVVYKEEGNYAYILTNAHVITSASGNDFYTDIEVVFSNLTRVRGTYIHFDKNEDVAVISVPKSDNYKVAKIVESDTDPKQSDFVMAIGNPNGQYFAPTIGIINATKLKTTTDYISGTSATTTYVYNTSATINPGNSGGPLFNIDGEVIAINSMQPKDDDKKGHNYSIPINHFIKVADYLVANTQRTYSRAKLNLEVKAIVDYSTDVIGDLGINVKKGVHVVNSIETDIKAGRIITHINQHEINTLADYEYELLKYSKDEIITLTTVDVSGTNTKTVNLKLK